MPRLLYFLLVITIITFAASCKKDSKDPEEVFYGIWVKGTNTGDTLRFYKKNGKHIVQSNQSFNPLMYAPVEQPYKYVMGQLSVGPFISSPSIGFPGYRTIESFVWKNAGREFEINGFEMYMFISATMTKFTFTKVQ